MREFLAVTAAGAALVGAGYAVDAALAAFTATSSTLTAAIAMCAAALVTCPDITAVAVAQGVAALAYRQALALFTGMLAAYGVAQQALQDCRTREEERRRLAKETSVAPSGGSESNCGDGEEEWCEYTFSWPDGILRVTRNYCWCEGEYAT